MKVIHIALHENKKIHINKANTFITYIPGITLLTSSTAPFAVPVIVLQLETKEQNKISIVGLYDPEDNGLNIEMWSNSNGNEIKLILNKYSHKPTSSALFLTLGGCVGCNPLMLKIRRLKWAYDCIRLHLSLIHI